MMIFYHLFVLNDYFLLLIIFVVNCVVCIMSNDSFQYVQHNLHDYCTDRHWSDYPGHKTIPAEKSLLIRNPLIFNFNTNSSNKFVSYCLIRLTASEGKRLYAVGTSSGISTNGKQWFTESLHFTPTRQKILSKLKVREDFERTTDNNALELVFEQLNRQEFKFQLVVTPFRQIGNESKCEKEVEFKCSNNRCIDLYLICDNHNNCGDSTDESVHCLTKMVDESSTTGPHSHFPATTEPPVYRTTHTYVWSRDNKTLDNTINTNNKFLFLSKSFDFQTIIFYILIVLGIIIIVTIINFIVWCLVTKRDQSFLDMGTT